MANNKRFFKTISLAHWHDKLSIAAQLPMVHSFRWEQTCELVVNVENNEAWHKDLVTAITEKKPFFAALLLSCCNPFLARNYNSSNQLMH